MTHINKIIEIWHRVAWRIGIGAVLTILAFVVVQPLTIYTGAPEVMRVLSALAVIYWFDLSLLTGRMILEPRLDHQDIGKTAALTSNGAAVVYVMRTISLLVKLGMLLWLYQLV